MRCQVCDKLLLAFEEEGLTCFDCIAEVSKAEGDIASGRVRDADEVFRDLDDEFAD